MKKIIKSVLPKFALQYYRSLKRNVTGKLKAFQYRGKSVICNMCGASFRSFGPYGIVKRENAYCFNCHSLERDRTLWKFINEATDILKGKKIRLLHIAPESFFYHAFDKNPDIEYHPGDLFPEVYHQRGLSKVAKIDLTELTYEDGYFDVIICNHVLEHIPDDRKAMQELFRILNREGMGIFMVPINGHPKPPGFDDNTTYEDFTITSDEGRLKAFGQEDHVRVYGHDFNDRLTSTGFYIHVYDGLAKLSPEELFRYGFNTIYLLPYCTKA